MDSKPRILFILGSTRQGREGEKVGNWIHEEARKREDFETDFIDLRELELPFFDEPVSPAYNQGKYASSKAQEWAERVGKADGYVVISPEYNHGYPAVLKNALDYVYKEWNNKPAGLVTYSGGPWGGVRAAQQLRQVFVELQMVPIRNAVHLAFVNQKFNEAGVMTDENAAKLPVGFFDQLIWWSEALRAARISK